MEVRVQARESACARERVRVRERAQKRVRVREREGQTERNSDKLTHFPISTPRNANMRVHCLHMYTRAHTQTHTRSHTAPASHPTSARSSPFPRQSRPPKPAAARLSQSILRSPMPRALHGIFTREGSSGTGGKVGRREGGKEGGAENSQKSKACDDSIKQEMC